MLLGTPGLCRGASGGQSVQLDHPAHVADEVPKSDPGPGAHDADAAQQRAAHVVALRAEHVLDPGADLRTRPVTLLLAFGERAVAMGLAVDPALQAPRRQLVLDLGRPAGAVRPDVGGGVVVVKKAVEGLAVMDRRIGHLIAPDQLDTRINLAAFAGM